jgi:hypothetical protein
MYKDQIPYIPVKEIIQETQKDGKIKGIDHSGNILVRVGNGKCSGTWKG